MSENLKNEMIGRIVLSPLLMGGPKATGICL